MLFFQIIFTFFAFSKLLADKLDTRYCTKDNLKNCRSDGTIAVEWNLVKERNKSEDNWDLITHKVNNVKIPANFDSRTHWPECKSVISRIRSQGDCEDCWSYCSAMVLADRACIASMGMRKDLIDFSIVDLNTCCKNCLVEPGKSPCENKGILLYAFQHIVDIGLAYEECKHYDFSELNKPKPKCEKHCEDKRKDYEKRHHHGNLALLSNKETDLKEIQIEIMQNGPICAQLMNVTEKFKKWIGKKEIFIAEPPKKRRPRPTAGAHAVRIIGWGIENKIPYWLCANSWGATWGEDGFFKIRRGTNEFNMEEQFTTVLTGPLIEPPKRSTSTARNLRTDTLFVFTIFCLLVILSKFSV